MRTARETIRMALIIVAALLLAALLGILVTAANADGPVIWKQHCPAQYEVRLEPAKDWGGVHVLCVRMAEVVKR